MLARCGTLVSILKGQRVVSHGSWSRGLLHTGLVDASRVTGVSFSQVTDRPPAGYAIHVAGRGVPVTVLRHKQAVGWGQQATTSRDVCLFCKQVQAGSAALPLPVCSTCMSHSVLGMKTRIKTRPAPKSSSSKTNIVAPQLLRQPRVSPPPPGPRRHTATSCPSPSRRASGRPRESDENLAIRWVVRL